MPRRRPGRLFTRGPSVINKAPRFTRRIIDHPELCRIVRQDAGMIQAGSAATVRPGEIGRRRGFIFEARYQVGDWLTMIKIVYRTRASAEHARGIFMGSMAA